MIIVCLKVLLVGSFDLDVKKKWLLIQFSKNYVGFF